MKNRLGLIITICLNLFFTFSQRGNMRGRAPMEEEYGDSGGSSFSGLLILVLIFIVYHFGSKNKNQ